jgi:hypothetical protein
VRFTRGLRPDVIVAILVVTAGALAQDAESKSSNEIPIERCDMLPVVRVRAAGQELRFLLDTGATTDRLDKADKRPTGHGVAMCHRVDGKWRILNMHNALLEPASGSKP